MRPLRCPSILESLVLFFSDKSMLIASLTGTHFSGTADTFPGTGGTLLACLFRAMQRCVSRIKHDTVMSLFTVNRQRPALHRSDIVCHVHPATPQI